MPAACGQVRTLLQKRLCRPVPLEMIGAMTVGGLRALAEEAGQGEGLLGLLCMRTRCMRRVLHILRPHAWYV